MFRAICIAAICVSCSVASAQSRSVRKTGRPAPQKKAPPARVESFFPADPSAEIEVVRERYDNGEVKIQREMTLDTEGNYIRHGQWTLWNESGAEIAKGAYGDNRRDGQWVRIFSGKESELMQQAPFSQFTAPFTSRAEFDRGRLHGTWTITDSQGRVVSSWQYEEGRRHGAWLWNFPSGAPMREITYVDGLVDGQLTVKSEAGETVVEHNYQNGRRLATKTENYKSGERKSEGVYLFAQRILQEQDDWWTAKLAQYTTVGTDDRHGPWTTWHENGQVECRASYEYGLRTGKITWWYPNGQQRLTGAYESGKPVGSWVWWHPNGQKATLGHYDEAGEPNGDWVYWNESGRLMQRSDLSVASTLSEPAEQPTQTTRRSRASR